MSLLHGPVFQICWVVEDIAASERWFTEFLGVPRWMRIEDVHLGPETCTFRGQPADFRINVALGYAGDQQFELIQPLSGASLYQEHIDGGGPGLHHVAYVPEDYEATLAEARAAGLEVSLQGAFAESGIEFAYLDGAHAGAPHIELVKISPETMAWFDAMRTAAAG